MYTYNTTWTLYMCTCNMYRALHYFYMCTYNTTYKLFLHVHIQYVQSLHYFYKCAYNMYRALHYSYMYGYNMYRALHYKYMYGYNMYRAQHYSYMYGYNITYRALHNILNSPLLSLLYNPQQSPRKLSNTCLHKKLKATNIKGCNTKKEM